MFQLNTFSFITFGHPPSAWFIPWDRKSALMVFTLMWIGLLYTMSDYNPTSFSDATAAHCMTLDTGLRGMYWLCSSGSDLTSSIMWPEVGHTIRCRCWTVNNGPTMLVCKLDWSVDPPALLGDVQFDLKLLLNQVIAKIVEKLSFKKFINLFMISFTLYLSRYWLWNDPLKSTSTILV